MLFSLSLLVRKHIMKNPLVGFMLFFGGVLLLASQLLAEFSFQEKQKYIRDIGLTCTALFSTLAILLITTYHLHDEFESKRYFLMRQQPMAHSVYLWGNWLGILWVLLEIVFIMAMVLMIALIFQTSLGEDYVIATYFQFFLDKLKYGIQSNLLILKGVLLIIMQNLLLMTFALVSSLFMKPLWNLILCLCVYISGNVFLGVEQYLNKINMEGLKHSVQGLRYLLPNFSYFNVIDDIVLGKFIHLNYFVWLSVYAFSYICLLMIVGKKILNSKEF